MPQDSAIRAFVIQALVTPTLRKRPTMNALDELALLAAGFFRLSPSVVSLRLSMLIRPLNHGAEDIQDTQASLLWDNGR
jgi:hypothetical protein